jgi:hypothetical protein
MSGWKLIPVLLATLAINPMAKAQTIELSSPSQQVTLLELYTSEGCSSCPPADRWLSTYKQDARLWQQIVPVAFHVDYWDYLGWRDRFSDAKYSRRQYDYKRHHHLKVVYTPGLVQNGREFRGWSSGRNPVQDKTAEAGILKAVIGSDNAHAEFAPSHSTTKPLLLHVAWLAFDQHTQVGAGENSGRVLKHDFVVTDLQQFRSRVDGTHRWELGDLLAKKPTAATAIALWVSREDDPTPLQATGGWLAN